MKKVHGSASAFQIGNLVITQYNSGCLRSILLAANGVRDQIDSKHMIRGAFFEDDYAREHPDLEREKNIFHSISPFSDTYYSSRCDFYQHSDIVEERRVVELKSTESKSVLTEVIKKGNYKLNNLAQLVSYMCSLESPNGTLHYAYLEPLKETPKVYLKKAERLFNVEIEATGHLIIDDKDSGYTAHDVLAHRQAAATCITENTVEGRPYNWNAGFDSPCRMCPFKTVCDAWDHGVLDTTEDFIEASRNKVGSK